MQSLIIPAEQGSLHVRGGHSAVLRGTITGVLKRDDEFFHDYSGGCLGITLIQHGILDGLLPGWR